MTTDLLSAQFKFNDTVIQTGLDGLSADDAHFAPASGGNSIQWIAAHITATRMRALELLGAAPLWTAAECEHAALFPLERIVTTFNESSSRIQTELARADFARLVGERPLGVVLATFVCHEAYHAGQIHLLRRMLGKERSFG